MESYGVVTHNRIAKESTRDFRCPHDNVNDHSDDDDDASQAMEEQLRKMMNRPLMDDCNPVKKIDDDDEDDENDIHMTKSLDISNLSRNEGVDHISPVDEWNDISLIVFQDDSIESIDIRHVVVVQQDDTVSLLKHNTTTAHDVSLHKGHQNHNKRIRNQCEAATNDCSSSSEGTSDEHQNSDHTCPETPPTPLSFESVDHFISTSSSLMISVHERLQPQQQPLNHHDSDSDVQQHHNTPTNDDTVSNASSIHPLPTLSNSEPFDPPTMRSTSMAYNPITSHSPRRKSRSRRQRATMGMSLFSCLDGASDDVFSDSDQVRNRSVFRQRSHIPIGDEDDNDDDGVTAAVSACDSEEALEYAAQIIRSQLLQNEMLDLAAEAEQAADSGMDRFTRHPVAGVVQDDLIRTTATTNTVHNNSFQRKLSIQAMRRSLSEGSYVPQQPRRLSERNKSTTNFVSNIFPDSMISSSSNHINIMTTISSAKNQFALRDVKEVFPAFQSFHTHLRTHLSRGDISATQLSFQEEGASDERNSTATTVGEVDGRTYHIHRSPTRHMDPFCKSDDSPLGSVFSLPLCSNETTSTPLTTNRKLVGDHSQAQLPFPIGATVPVNKFLQNFNFVDQWSNAITSHCRSNANRMLVEAPLSMCHDDDQPNDDSHIVNLLSVQVMSSDKVRQVPRKLDILPDLEYDYLAHVLRKPMATSTIRLQPKIGHRLISQDTMNDVVSFTESSSTSYNLAYSINDPKALFDETEYDSDEDCGNSLIGVDREVLRINSAPEPNSSLNSLLDDPALIWTPTIGNKSIYHSKYSAAIVESGMVAAILPPPPSIPDFVTPARLRKIRGSVRRAASQSSVDTVVDAIAASLTLPMSATTSSQQYLKNSNQNAVNNMKEMCNKHDENEQPVEIDEKNSKLSDIYAIQVIPENDLSTIQNESRCSDKDEIFNSSLTVLDLSHKIHEEILVNPNICWTNNATLDESRVASKSDPVVIAWLNDTPFLKSSKSCRSLDGLITKVPSHHDCGCLSLSPASSTCSDDDIRGSERAADGNDIFTSSTASLRKVLSSGAINDYQSWDAFLERFHSNSPVNATENSVSSSPKQKNSIRDAMSILSSKLSPNRMNNCAAQEKAMKEQQLRALRDQIKENDEFMNNFLYCSKPLDDLHDDITMTNMDVDGAAVSKTDRTASSFLCLDDNMMSCGESDNGYCCNYFFDGALTMGNIILPSSFSTRRRPSHNPIGTVATHQRVRSFINLGGGAPALRRESYQSENTNHHNSSSWLDLANELDGAFDTWVLGGTSQTRISNLEESETCLSHVSFQPPTLKKLRNIIEDSSRDESEEGDYEDGEFKYDDDIWMVRSPVTDTKCERDVNVHVMLEIDDADCSKEQKMEQ